MPRQTAMTDVEAALEEAVAGRRVRLRRGRKTVAVVPVEDLARLEELDRREEAEDLAEARAAIAEFNASGEPLIPVAEVRRRHVTTD